MVLNKSALPTMVMVLITVSTRSLGVIQYNVRVSSDGVTFLNLGTNTGITVDITHNTTEIHLIKKIGDSIIPGGRIWLDDNGQGVRYPDDVGGVRQAITSPVDMDATEFVEFLVEQYPNELDDLNSLTYK